MTRNSHPHPPSRNRTRMLAQAARDNQAEDRSHPRVQPRRRPRPVHLQHFRPDRPLRLRHARTQEPHLVHRSFPRRHARRSRHHLLRRARRHGLRRRSAGALPRRRLSHRPALHGQHRCAGRRQPRRPPPGHRAPRIGGSRRARPDRRQGPSTTPTTYTGAANQAIDEGSNYYTISYIPHQPEVFDTRVRNINVTVNQPDLTLTLQARISRLPARRDHHPRRQAHHGSHAAPIRHDARHTRAVFEILFQIATAQRLCTRHAS